MDLQRFVGIVLRSLPGILLLTIVAGAAAFGVSMVLPKEWESEARLLVGSLTETDTQQLEAYQVLATTYSEVATSTPTMQRVIKRLSLPDTLEDLAERVVIRTAVGQAVIRVTATAKDPQEAADLANAFASEIVKLGSPGTRNVSSLVSRYQPAVPPERPSSPKILINTAIAAAAGFVVGVGLAVLLAMIRDLRRATAGRQEGPWTALVPTVAPPVGPPTATGGPAWSGGGQARPYPTIAVSAVAPMPRTAERPYEVPRIATGSNVAPPPGPTPAAWQPRPTPDPLYLATTPRVVPRMDAATEVSSGDSTFLEAIEARTAPPPRPTHPQVTSTNGATASASPGAVSSGPAMPTPPPSPFASTVPVRVAAEPVTPPVSPVAMSPSLPPTAVQTSPVPEAEAVMPTGIEAPAAPVPIPTESPVDNSRGTPAAQMSAEPAPLEYAPTPTSAGRTTSTRSRKAVAVSAAATNPSDPVAPEPKAAKTKRASTKKSAAPDDASEVGGPSVSKRKADSAGSAFIEAPDATRAPKAATPGARKSSPAIS